jgi:hypothetical protein
VEFVVTIALGIGRSARNLKGRTPRGYTQRTMASPQTQTIPQRLAAIREQMSLLSDYL